MVSGGGRKGGKGLTTVEYHDREDGYNRGYNSQCAAYAHPVVLNTDTVPLFKLILMYPNWNGSF